MPTLLEQDRRTRPTWADESPWDDAAPPDEPGDGNDGGGDDDNRDDGDREGDDGADDTGGRWVTVATFWKSTEAHLARLRLEAEGIDVLMFDEAVVATDWFFANAVGGIKLRVPESDAVVARALLAGRVGPTAMLADGEPVSDGQMLCPRCGSDAIYATRLSRRLAFVAILLLGLPLPMLLRRTRCAACGFEWR